MNLREIFISIGCCAAAVSLGFGKPVRANQLQSDRSASRATERCAASRTRTEETAGCERIDGHVRVQFGSRIPDVSGHGQTGLHPSLSVWTMARRRAGISGCPPANINSIIPPVKSTGPARGKTIRFNRITRSLMFTHNPI